MAQSSPNRTRRALLVGITAACCGILDSCLFPILPIPPPSAFAVTTPCTDPDCQPDGLSVQITGRAAPGAIVIGVNRSRTLPDGRSYMVTTTALTDPAPDAGPSLTRNYTLDFLPVRTPGFPTVVSRPGDMIDVFSLVADPSLASDGWRRSLASSVTVSR